MQMFYTVYCLLGFHVMKKVKLIKIKTALYIFFILFLTMHRYKNIFSSGYYLRSALSLMRVHNVSSYKKAEVLFKTLLKKRQTPDYYYYRIKNILNWAEYVGRADISKHKELLHRAWLMLKNAFSSYKNHEQRPDFKLMLSFYHGLKGNRNYALKILKSIEDDYKDKRYFRYLKWKFSGYSPDPFCSEINDLIKNYPRFFKARFDRARSFYNKGVLHVATREARYCVNLRPNSPWAVTFYGVCILEHNEPYRAMAYFRKALEIEYYAPAVFEMGKSLYLYGKLKSGLKYFKKAVDINPGHVSANFYLGKSYMILGKKAKAVNYFKRYLKLNPNAIDFDDVKKWIQRLSK